MLLNNLGEEEIARKVEQYFEQKNENETQYYVCTFR